MSTKTNKVIIMTKKPLKVFDKTGFTACVICSFSCMIIN